MTTIYGAPHGRFPKWSLIPWQSGWAIYWFTEDAARLSSREIDGVLFDRPTRFRFGPIVRFRAPRILHRGRQRVRVDAVTPVVVPSTGRTTWTTTPTADTILSALGLQYVQRLAPPGSTQWEGWVAERLRAELVNRSTQPAHVPLGGKYGDVHGWVGALELDVNATTRWLLGAAERTGLGSRTAFGFGRIRVTDVGRAV